MNLKEAKADRPKRILLLGFSGSGKTRFIGTMPSPYIADFDDNLNSLIGHDVEFDPFHMNMDDSRKAYADFKKVLSEWRKEPKRGTFCVDSLSRYADAILAWALKENGKNVGGQMTQADWGKAIAEVKLSLGQITTLPCHVVVTAHYQAEKDEMLGSLRYEPLIFGKSLPGLLPTYFDEVWRMAVIPPKDGKGTAEHKVQVIPDQKYDIIKSGMNARKCFQQYEEPDFGKMLGKYQTTLNPVEWDNGKAKD